MLSHVSLAERHHTDIITHNKVIRCSNTEEATLGTTFLLLEGHSSYHEAAVPHCWLIQSHQLLLSAWSQSSRKEAVIEKNLPITISCCNPMPSFGNEQNLYS